MAGLFDFVKAASSTKEDLLRGPEGELNRKDYNAFMMNRAFSYFNDTIAYANEMNSAYHLDVLLQNDFYLTGLRQRKRFTRWAKSDNAEKIKPIQDYYQCSRRRAEEYLGILTEDQVAYINEFLNRGKET